MIKIDKPFISNRKNYASVEAKINITEDTVSNYLKRTSQMTKAVWRNNIDYPPSIEQNLYFATQKKYKKFLCIERSDAFVMALLWYAIVSGSDIFFETPMSKRLYDGLTNTLIKKLCGTDYKRIKLIGPTLNEPLNTESAVGAGMTYGVDSYYTYLTYKDELTHLSFYDCGIPSVPDWMDASTNKIYYEEVHKHMRKKADNVESVCEQIGLPFVFVTTNLEDNFYMGGRMYRVMYINFSCTLALQHPFSKYISSSSGHGEDLEVSPTSPSQYYENLITDTCKTETLNYITSDNETRFNKIMALKDYKPAYNLFDVCINEGDNCGNCYGCLKTIIVLDLINALDNFKNVFDIEYYKQNRKKLILRFTEGIKFPEAKWVTGSWKDIVKHAPEYNNEASKIILEINKDL